MSTTQQEPSTAPAAEEVRPMGSLPPVDPVAPTGPIDGLGDLPPSGAPADAPTGDAPRADGSAPAAGRRFAVRRGSVRVRLSGAVRASAARNHRPARLAAPALGGAALVLLELGLLVHEGGRNLWSRAPLWAAFATVAGVVGLVGLAAGVRGLRRLGGNRSWALAAGGLCGLAVFWLLVALPTAATDRGFLLTAALACLGAASWTVVERGRSAADER